MTRKKKLLLIISFSVVLTFFIYRVCYDKKADILVMGDSLCYGQTLYGIKGYSYNDYLKDYYTKNNLLKSYNSDYCYADNFTKELLESIANNNISTNNLTINQLIANAEIITIGIGIDELNSNNYNTYLNNIDYLLQNIRKINKKRIYLIGLFGDNEKISDVNEWLSKIALKNDTEYIPINELNTEAYLFQPNTKYLNYRGQEIIYQKIIAKS